MKTNFRMTFVVLALGMLGGYTARAAPQETGAATGQDVAVTTKVGAAVTDNGALPGDSHVRIVRLSDVKGTLALDRKTGKGFEQTMQNMPIVEGNRLQTADGYAEVEFEDNSTLRLAPNTLVDFPLLALRNTGAKASTMKVVHGTVYVSTESTKGNEFELEAGGAKMFVSASTHLRLEVDGANSVMSVFNGNVEVQRGADSTVVGKKETLTLDASQMDVAKKIPEEPFDAWDKESIDYHQRYAAANTFAGGGNAYGLSDLNYYGSFINTGFGSFWQPYFVGSGWSPYGNGLWALYPGAGYSWVSPYPWGWLPYHSGSWSFVPGFGWGWQPGGTWNGLNNVVATNGVLPAGTAVQQGVVHAPLRTAAMPQAPAGGATASSLVLTNEKPLVFSKEDKPGNFVFQRDSAGLGVPRGSLGNLNKISTDAMRHGSVNMPVYATGPGGMDGSRASRGPSTLRSGTPGEFSAGERGNMSASSMSRQGSSGPSGASASRGGGGMSSAGGAAMGGGAAGGSGGNSGGGSHGAAAASPK